MRRTLESPEAETPSYCPVCMRLNISSDVAAVLLFTVQPVSLVNWPTQL